MKNIYLPLLILFPLFLSSCSMPITFWLFNNMAYDVTIITQEKETKIEAGNYKETTGLDYTFSIKFNRKRLTYNTKDIPLSHHVHWVGWGPFSKRMLYVQLEVDGKIWVLNEKTQEPVIKFIEQTGGFPLEPNT